MKKAIYMTDLHFEHVSWVKELVFQKEELGIFQKRLEGVAPRFTSKEVSKQVEHFQNSFIRHNEVIDILQHDINAKERALGQFAKANPIASDHVHFKDHSGMRDKVETQQDLYRLLKKEFLRFLTETM